MNPCASGPFTITLRGLVVSFVALAALSVACLFVTRPASAATCESLATLALPDTTVVLATSHSAGMFTPPKPLDLPGVAPTIPGEHLLRRVQPALSEIREALGQVSGLRNKPVGRVRLLAPRLAVKTVLAPTIGRFVRDYPDITLEVTTDDSRMDIVAGGFDAGVHFGEYIEKDMIAVRVSLDQRPAIAGSPSYFESHAKPRSPRDLIRHRCINFRHGSAGVYRWEFEKGRKSLSVAVNGPLIVDDLELVISAAVDGVGLAYMSEEHGAEHLASGALVKVLEDWCQPYPGFLLYYPSRRNQPAALAALINTVRLTEKPAI